MTAPTHGSRLSSAMWRKVSQPFAGVNQNGLVFSSIAPVTTHIKASYDSSYFDICELCYERWEIVCADQNSWKKNKNRSTCGKTTLQLRLIRTEQKKTEVGRLSCIQT